MTPQARVQAAIELLDQVIAAAASEGPPADVLVQRYFKSRRYAGSKDRRAVRELMFRAVRLLAERPASGRQAMLAVAERDPGVAALFDGSVHAPAVRASGEGVAAAGIIPGWLDSEISALIGAGERAALLDRAPLDLRVNVARTSRDVMARQFVGAEPTPISPWGLRLACEASVSTSPAFAEGLVEIQDEGSQLVALACRAGDGVKVLDLCAGAGGKALAIAAAAPGVTVLATDTNRQRLAQLEPRAHRAGTKIATRLLDGGQEAQQLADLAGQSDVVLVDAPCSGSGTWRRNPDGRWRLTPERLDRLTALQARLLDLAAPLVKPGGAIVYATCSVLGREGAGQAAAFFGRHSSWTAQEDVIAAGRVDGLGRLLTPGHDRTDGFFVARFTAPC